MSFAGMRKTGTDSVGVEHHQHTPDLRWSLEKAYRTSWYMKGPRGQETCSVSRCSTDLLQGLESIALSPWHKATSSAVKDQTQLVKLYDSILLFKDFQKRDDHNAFSDGCAAIIIHSKIFQDDDIRCLMLLCGLLKCLPSLWLTR